MRRHEAVPRYAYTLIEAAEALTLSPSLLREEIRRGRLGAVLAGRRIIIPRHALEAYCARYTPVLGTTCGGDD